MFVAPVRAPGPQSARRPFASARIDGLSDGRVAPLSHATGAEILRRVKLSALRMAKQLRVFALTRDSAWRRQRLLILCYHGVSLDDEHLWSDLYMPADVLRQRFTVLRNCGYQVLRLDDAVRRLYERTLPPRSVAITFDDGAYDFYALAYPLLREFGFHATLYLTTYYCSYQRPVFDPVTSYLLWKQRGMRFDATGLLAGGGSVVAPIDAGRRAAMHAQIRRYAEECGLCAAEKDERARLLAGRLGADYDRILQRRLLHLMSPAEVAQLPADTVSVQLHTHRHRTPAHSERFEQEIRDNRDAIVSMRPGDSEPTHFCYPSGDCKPELLPWLRRLGVRSATTCVPQVATRSTDPLLLPRFVDSTAATMVEFEAWLSGVAAIVPKRGGSRRWVLDAEPG
jgi:peptidoglycan/xylan/chitin deacetylase (PgdA/CDA1 family)